jgi:hypothetical protein
VHFKNIVSLPSVSLGVIMNYLIILLFVI